ncbi:pilus assembly protein FimV [Plasticicumulans acidivorans]|uniref:Pilus assembly protein FimV n=1 Tax=Plasticicumulans acidivorans TaxID=886464 RepID=A0A317MTH8_9GAMM|nr:pilus assembly protein FimV [Plasticicumulans acidivorans]
MTKGNRRSRALLAGLLLAPGVAAAIGVGPIQVHSGLNQPLQADVELLSVVPDELQNYSVRIAPARAFEQLGLERIGPVSDLEFQLQSRPDGHSYIHITSKQPVRDPALNFLVELSGPNGQLLREFAILLDPVRPGARPSRSGIAIAQGASVSPALPSGPRGGYGPVQRGETLWAIADRLRPAGMPTAVAVRRLFDTNPAAFIGRNPSALRAGAMLSLPETEGWQVAAAPTTPAAAVPPINAVPPVTSSGEVRVPQPLAPSAPAAVGNDAQVRLVAPESTPPAGPAELPAAPPAAGPDPLVNAAPVAQIAVEDGRLRLQASGLEHLQSRLETQPAAAAPPPVPVNPAAPKVDNRPAVATAPIAPAVAPRQSPPVPKETGFFDYLLDDPLTLGGLGLAAVAALAGGLLVVRRRRQAELDGASVQPEFKRVEPASVDSTAAAGESPRSLPEATGSAEQGDVAERASLLAAVGKYPEARALLEQALTQAPDSTTVRLRLLDVLHAMRDATAFRVAAGPLRELVYADTDPLWLRVARMGREVCPEDPLFNPPAAASSAEASTPAVPSEGGAAGAKTPAPAPAAPLPGPASEPPALGDMSGLTFERVAPAAEKGRASSGALDDLSLGDLDFGDVALPNLSTAPKPEVQDKPKEAAPAGGFDLTFDLPDLNPTAPVSTKAETSAAAAAVKENVEETPADTGFTFEPVLAPPPIVEPLQLDDVPVVPEHKPSVESPVLSMGPAEMVEAGADEEDEFVETKLDLALAYIDMDDPLGARTLLEEVLVEGGKQQRLRAQALLDKLAS